MHFPIKKSSAFMMLAGAVVALVYSGAAQAQMQNGPANVQISANSQTRGASALARGDAFFRKGDFDNASRLYDEAAKLGNATAKTKLDGMSYTQPGDKIATDLMEKAESMKARSGQDVCDRASLYAKAAEAGNSQAAVEIGRIWEQWSHLPCSPPEAPGDYKSLTLGKAMQWFVTAARAGNTEGMQELATIYLSGIGIPKDPVEGHRWLELAADRGSMEAETRLRQLDKAGR